MVTGLWAFYIDNFPFGQSLIRHPVVNRMDLMVSEQASYPPMRKIFCDRRVISSSKMTFYRVQGTKGWIVDVKRKEKKSKIMDSFKNKMRTKSSNDKDLTSMLLPVNKVHTGLFAYRCLEELHVHIRPKRRDRYCTTLKVERNDIIVADLIRESKTHEGTFARLTDGSGWVSLENGSGEKSLEVVPILRGSWKFQCVSTVPICALCQPIDRDSVFKTKIYYKKGTELLCDSKIETVKGTVFYRVKGSHGFVPGRDLVEKRMSILARDVVKQDGWTPDFVRGIASLVKGVEELDHDKEAQMLTFGLSSVDLPVAKEANILGFGSSASKDLPIVKDAQMLSYGSFSKDRPLINVYYATKMVGSSSNGSSHLGRYRRDCCPSDVAEIFQDPSVLAKSSVDYASDGSVSDKTISPAEEVCLRQELVDCYVKSEQLKKRQLSLLTALKNCDDKRAVEEDKMKMRATVRVEALDQLELDSMISEEELWNSTCEECGAQFKDAKAKEKHWKSVHAKSCPTCGNIFNSLQGLAEHQEETGHSSGYLDTSHTSHTSRRSSLESLQASRRRESLESLPAPPSPSGSKKGLDSSQHSNTSTPSRFSFLMSSMTSLEEKGLLGTNNSKKVEV